MSIRIRKHWRAWLLGAVTVVAIAVSFSFAPIAQDPGYHRFADGRHVLGIPNFWNAATNLAFVVVGIFGLSRPPWRAAGSLAIAYRVFCIGVVLIGIGSGYYHYAPSTASLVWDRLPITVVFMALFSTIVRDRVSEKIGSAMLWPLIATGVASVIYWYWSEQRGAGDLRAYAVVQFLPMLLIPLMLLFCDGSRRSTPWLWAMLGTYAVAKLAEHYDGDIYAFLGVVSGHSTKHVLAALAVLWAVFALRRIAEQEN